MKREYDFPKGVRGKFSGRKRHCTSRYISMPKFTGNLNGSPRKSTRKSET